MTRDGAVEVLRRLAVGLGPDLAGCARLLERISETDDAEALRDALVETGARALLAGPAVRVCISNGREA